jgi:hypothetical protein
MGELRAGGGPARWSPRIDCVAAAIIIAEIGTDLTRFPPPGTWPPGRSSHPGQGVRREEERQRLDRPRQPVSRPRPGRGRHRCGPDRHLPQRSLSADRPPPRQESRCRHRPLHPCHHLALSGPGARYTDLGSDFYDTRISPEQRKRAPTSTSLRPSAARSPWNSPPDQQPRSPGSAAPRRRSRCACSPVPPAAWFGSGLLAVPLPVVIKVRTGNGPAP